MRFKKNTGFLWMLLIVMAMGGCGVFASEKFDWEQEVRLHDGSSLWVKRQTIFSHYGELAQISQPSPLADSFEFVHPTTRARIVWPKNYDVRPLFLDFEQDVPFFVAFINAGKHYNLGCPPTYYALYKFIDGQWLRIDIRDLPTKFTRANMVGYVSKVLRDQIEKSGRKMNLLAVDKVLRPPKAQEALIISRLIVNPLYFCGGTVDSYYSAGVTKKLQDRFGTNPAPDILSEEEAVEFGIIRKGGKK